MSKIRRLREKRHLTQAEMADYLGMSLANYGKKENNQIRFSINEAKKLSDFFGLSIEQIFFDENSQKLREEFPRREVKSSVRDNRGRRKSSA